MFINEHKMDDARSLTQKKIIKRKSLDVWIGKVPICFLIMMSLDFILHTVCQDDESLSKPSTTSVEGNQKLSDGERTSGIRDAKLKEIYRPIFHIYAPFKKKKRKKKKRRDLDPALKIKICFSPFYRITFNETNFTYK